MVEKLGVGIIGCGAVSGAHASAWNTFPEDCEIIAVCDKVEPIARLEDFGAQTMYLDYHDLLADERIHVVSVCTPHYLHAPVTIAAAKAGKHVIVEKPMAMNIGEAHEMIAAARENNIKLTVVFQRRVDAKLRFIKERVIPEIGDIEFSYLIDSHFRTEKYYESVDWWGTWQFAGGGVFVSQAIHTWDIFQWYQGGVDVAYGYWTNLLHPSIEVEDIGYGLVEFACGSYGKLFTTSCCKLPDENEEEFIGKTIGGLRVFGTKGKITGSDFSLNSRSLEKRLKNEMESVIQQTKYTGHTAQIHDLIAAIREDREPEVSGDTAKEALKILNGIHLHGWNHAQRFHDWVFDNFEMPESCCGDKPIAENAEEQGWRGGGLIEQLAEIVKSQERKLDAPFWEI